MFLFFHRNSYCVVNILHTYYYFAESLCIFNYIFVPFPLLKRLSHSFTKLQLCEVTSTHLASSINSTTHNTSSNARSHLKQWPSHTRSHNKYWAFYSRSYSMNIAFYSRTYNKNKASYLRSHRVPRFILNSTLGMQIVLIQLGSFLFIDFSDDAFHAEMMTFS